MSDFKLRQGAATASGFFSGRRRYFLPLLLVLAVFVGWRLFFAGGPARKGMNMEMPAEPVKCNWRPDHEALKACHQMGATIAEALKKKCQG